MAATSREDFDALIRRAGLSLSPDEISQIYVGWGHLEPMLARLRGPAGTAPGTVRGREIEPAHIFRPDVFGTETP